jgi:hypothetical protein
MTTQHESDGSREVDPLADHIAASRPEDFDGHTAFAGLSAEQRLEWADRAARLFIELHGLAGASSFCPQART